MTVTRRGFLVRSATVAGGVLVLSLQACGGGTSDEEVRVRITGLVPSEASTVGKAWSKVTDEQDPAARLIEDLRDGGVDLHDAAAIGDGVRALIADDFASGRTAEVKQWVLSHTEGRLCAMAS